MLTRTGINTVQTKDVTKKVMLSVVAIFVLCCIMHPDRFALSQYPCIKYSDIANELEPSPHAIAVVKESDKPLCSLIPNGLDTSLLNPNESVTEFDIKPLAHRLKIEEGGAWQPTKCVSQHEVAIIVPFRNRSLQLSIFLSYMHPFLQKQMLNYRIFVIEQMEGAFNRAKLFNVGYAEALKIFPYHCFIFHDVDLIPQKLNNIYACTHQPRHMSSSVNTFRYNLPYRELSGGAVAILQKQFELVNGFSNMFFGWGGEDDDFHSRVVNRGMTLCRFPPDVARYTMLAHSKEMPSENRFMNLRSGRDRFATDGVNALQYTIMKMVYYPLYTWILVNL